MERTDPETAERIPDYRAVIDFRNVLAHGYDIVNNDRVWRYIEAELAPLEARVEELLAEADNSFGS